MITGTTDFLAYRVKNTVFGFLHLILHKNSLKLRFCWFLQTCQMNTFERYHGVYKVMYQLLNKLSSLSYRNSQKLITELDNRNEGKLHYNKWLSSEQFFRNSPILNSEPFEVYA